ncbi:atrial natriuretic peptide receptor 1-like isoform X2 [Paramacrobiotus metropolitanus]|uniref:atrial natriuretic peptide receptor 1-like isoform X2 n=1 Tax=Paramacrobiotus metropolitanus TaxID=2943436 RepID=UPI0024460E87|nr:atrial natriuretic peptide receptor 1-like isoform X2 [Paramacrobiotus metropolitanus]
MHNTLPMLLFLAGRLSDAVPAAPRKIYIGLILPNDTTQAPLRFVMPAMYVAVDDILAKYNLKAVLSTALNVTYPCSDTGSLSRGEAFVKSFNYFYMPPFGGTQNGPWATSAILGPYCSDKLLATIIASTAFNISQFTGGGTDISDISPYPYLCRTGYNKYQQFVVFQDLCRRQQWYNVSVIYDVNDADRVGDYTNYHELDLDKSDLSVTYFPVNIVNNSQISSTLTEASGHARIFGLFMNNTLLRPFMLAAANLSMTSGDYVFFTIDKYGDDALGPKTGWYRSDDTNSSNNAAKTAYSFLLVSGVTDKSQNPVYQASLAKFRAKAFSTKFNYTSYTMNYFALSFYNALMLIGYTMNLSQPKDLQMNYDPGPLMKNVAGKVFNDGAAGPIYITNGKDLREDYTLSAMTDVGNGTFTPIMSYFGLNDTVSDILPTYQWPDADGTFPPNEPKCGFKGTAEVCQAKTPITEIVVGIVLFLALLSVLLAFYLYRKHQEQVRLDKAWIALWSDLKVMRPDDGIPSAALITQKRQSIRARRESRRNSLEEAAGASMGASMGQSMSMLAVSPTRGLWKKQPVSVRWMKKRRMRMCDGLVQEVRSITKVRNENIAHFMGACLETGRILLLYELCSRGSLEETINSPTAKLEWPLRFSFINDIVRGMYFIHTSALKVHGRLFSGCCLIDSRFTMKISDVGLSSFFDLNIAEYWLQKRRTDFYYTQLWTAPEIIREQETNPEEVTRSSSKEADTYSFSIILQEIIMRMRPYGMYDLPAQKIYNSIKQHATPGGKPFRPLIDESMCHIDLITLCERCWSEIATERPTFSQIRVVMKDVVKNLGMGDRLNILEALLQQMEEHTLSLQAMIEEKDMLVMEQKARAEKLLFSNLPPLMTAALLRGEKVEPNYLDVCSVLVVDVINFNSVMERSSADETANFLGALHTFYASAATRFDCFLLESLTQRVTAASGLPIRNGILHARELGRLALTLLFQAKEFPVPHMPKEGIQVRFGIHSGPIVFGIVGKHVPRFCLFGETLNIATRMMTVEEAYKVRISAATRNIIEAFGSFRAFDSDEIYVKGHGKMKTYILVGEDGNIELMELQRKFYGGDEEPGGKRKSRLT